MASNSPRWLWGLLACLVVPVVAGLLWGGTVFYAKHRACVALGNGAWLGYEAIFDLSRPYLRPIVVPKTAQGHPILRAPLWAITSTSNTVYGPIAAFPGARGDAFVWRADQGLVLRSRDPHLYGALVAEAGPPSQDFGVDAIGPGAMMRVLMDQGGGGWCPTELVTW